MKSIKMIIELKRIWFLALVLIGTMILIIASNVSFVAENIIAQGIYPILSTCIGFISNIVPFSIIEIIVIIMPVFLLICFVYFLRSLNKSAGRRKEVILKAFVNVLCVGSVLFFLFVVLCGTNYYRKDFSYFSGLTVEASTKEELYALCLDMAGQVNEAREKIENVDENGVMKLNQDVYETAKLAKEAMQGIAEEYPILKGYYNNPKPLLLSKYLSYTNVTGLFMPFTMEANVNVDTVDFLIPTTMCHELAHLRGFMKEDEANYIAYMACINSGNPDLEYSGLLLAYYYSMEALYKEDAEMYWSVQEQLSEDVQRDLTADYDYWKKHENSKIGKSVSEVSNKINDTYLKVNGQENGVKSYGKVVDLIMAVFRMRGTDLSL